MHIVLVGINAKYIHSNLALYSLQAYAKEHADINCDILEFTINQPTDFILSEIFKANPDVIGFSCYIWNIDHICRLLVALRKILPKTIIILGGPQVTFHCEELLTCIDADYIVSGEGEAPFTTLMTALLQNTPTEHLPYIYKKGCPHIQQAPCELERLEYIPFVYNDLALFKNRILYYESSRGCPFGCSYCMSSTSKKVRFLPIERVFSDLSYFLAHNVKQVKFVDRTFNCNKQRTLDIFRYLIKHDNQITNFHFEIAADLLDDEIIDFVATARPGLFQFEIGVQSTNEQTLQTICRACNLDELYHNVCRLQQSGNIHLHLDLIAGLPFEDLASFRRSFNDVYALAPHQLQLGFLKVLPGSPIEQQAQLYQIQYNPLPVYEVLSTHVLRYQDLLLLKGIEQMVELCHNSGRYHNCTCYLLQFFPTPFDFYSALSTFYQTNNLHQQAQSKLSFYSVLYAFGTTLNGFDFEHFQWLSKYDLCLHEKYKKLPDWLTVDQKPRYRQAIINFYNTYADAPMLSGFALKDPKQLPKLAHLEIFPFDPTTSQPQQTFLLFNYAQPGIDGNATVYDVSAYFETI